MEAKDIISAQLSACLENTWFVSLLNSVKGLTEEQASWKPDEKSNSIFEIVNHLIYYNLRDLNRFKNTPDDIKVDSTFSHPEAFDWDTASSRLKETMTEWKEVVEKADITQIDSWSEKLAHLTIHTTYHTGQILYIRKLQGAWNSKEGVEG